MINYFLFIIYFLLLNIKIFIKIRDKMETIFTEASVSDDLFKHLKQMQNHLFDFKKLEIFTLPKPVCLQNEYSMNMFYLRNKWHDNFPS